MKVKFIYISFVIVEDSNSISVDVKSIVCSKVYLESVCLCTPH